MTVRGEGLAEGPANLATLQAVLHASGGSAAQVREALATNARRITETLGPYASALLEPPTAELHVAPVFRTRPAGRVTGYTGRYETRLLVTYFDALSPLVELLTGLPQSEVSGPWWSLQPGHPLHREARQAAIADARGRAQDYAAAFGGTLGELLEISDLEGGHGGPIRYARAMSPTPDDAGFDFDPQRQSVHAQVVLRCTLEGAGPVGVPQQ